VSAVYAEERQHAIASLVAERGRLAVTAVAEQFGVTTETVRRDLALLERAGLSHEEAEAWESRVETGSVLVGAHTDDARASQAADALQMNGAVRTAHGVWA